MEPRHFYHLRQKCIISTCFSSTTTFHIHDVFFCVYNAYLCFFLMCIFPVVLYFVLFFYYFPFLTLFSIYA